MHLDCLQPLMQKVELLSEREFLLVGLILHILSHGLHFFFQNAMHHEGIVVEILFLAFVCLLLCTHAISNALAVVCEVSSILLHFLSDHLHESHNSAASLVAGHALCLHVNIQRSQQVLCHDCLGNLASAPGTNFRQITAQQTTIDSSSLLLLSVSCTATTTGGVGTYGSARRRAGVWLPSIWLPSIAQVVGTALLLATKWGNEHKAFTALIVWESKQVLGFNRYGQQRPAHTTK